MYHVFTEDEIKLWRDWALELTKKPDDTPAGKLRVLKERMSNLHRSVVRAIPDASLTAWQVIASDDRIALWVEVAIFEVIKKAEQEGTKNKTSQTRERPRRSTEPRRLTAEQIEEAKKSIQDRYEKWLGAGVIRAVTYAAAQYRDVVKGLKFGVPDPDTKKNVPIAVWFDRIHAAPNGSAIARDMLMSLRSVLRSKKDFDERFKDGTPMSYAFGAGIPGNDARRGRDTLWAWIEADFCLPEQPKGRIKALRMDSSLDEQEGHPTGFAMGFGTTH